MFEEIPSTNDLASQDNQSEPDFRSDLANFRKKVQRDDATRPNSSPENQNDKTPATALIQNDQIYDEKEEKNPLKLDEMQRNSEVDPRSASSSSDKKAKKKCKKSSAVILVFLHVWADFLGYLLCTCAFLFFAGYSDFFGILMVGFLFHCCFTIVKVVIVVIETNGSIKNNGLLPIFCRKSYVTRSVRAIFFSILYTVLLLASVFVLMPFFFTVYNKDHDYLSNERGKLYYCNVVETLPFADGIDFLHIRGSNFDSNIESSKISAFACVTSKDNFASDSMDFYGLGYESRGSETVLLEEYKGLSITYVIPPFWSCMSEGSFDLEETQRSCQTMVYSSEKKSEVGGVFSGSSPIFNEGEDPPSAGRVLVTNVSENEPKDNSAGHWRNSREDSYDSGPAKAKIRRLAGSDTSDGSSSSSSDYPYNSDGSIKVVSIVNKEGQYTTIQVKLELAEYYFMKTPADEVLVGGNKWYPAKLRIVIFVFLFPLGMHWAIEIFSSIYGGILVEYVKILITKEPNSKGMRFLSSKFRTLALILSSFLWFVFCWVLCGVRSWVYCIPMVLAFLAYLVFIALKFKELKFAPITRYVQFFFYIVKITKNSTEDPTASCFKIYRIIFNSVILLTLLPFFLVFLFFYVWYKLVLHIAIRKSYTNEIHSKEELNEEITRNKKFFWAFLFEGIAAIASMIIDLGFLIAFRLKENGLVVLFHLAFTLLLVLFMISLISTRKYLHSFSQLPSARNLVLFPKNYVQTFVKVLENPPQEEERQLAPSGASLAYYEPKQ